MAKEVTNQTSISLPAHQLQGEPPTAKAARAMVKSLDKMDLSPSEKRVKSLVRKSKMDRILFWENLVFSLYVEQRAANKQAGRGDTPTDWVGPDKFSRTNWGEELIALQAACLKAGRKTQEFRILLHPEESAKLLQGFTAGFKSSMLELKKQLKWDDAPVEPAVSGWGEGRLFQGGHDPELLAEMQEFNKLKRQVLIDTGVIKPRAVTHQK